MRKHIVVFLDIDGVLNNEALLIQHGGDDKLDPEAINLVNELLRKTGANVVITSTWRLGHSLNMLQHIFKNNGFKYPERIIGATTDLPGKERGHEITLWLKQVPVDAFVVLDDDSDMFGVKDKHVKTTFKVGLNKEHIKCALQIIKKQLKETTDKNDKKACTKNQ
jgi:hypothetical protein